MSKNDQNTASTGKASGQAEKPGIQGKGAPDVTGIKKLAIPNSWGSIGLDSDQLSELGAKVATIRAHAAIRGQRTVYFGDTASTWHSRGKVDDKTTIRSVTIMGKDISYKVTPIDPAFDALRPYFMIVDLWQNYVSTGESALFGVWLDFAVLAMSDTEAVKLCVMGLCGVPETTFNAYMALAKSTLDLVAVLTGEPVKVGAGMFVKSSDTPKERTVKAKSAEAVTADGFADLFKVG